MKLMYELGSALLIITIVISSIFGWMSDHWAVVGLVLSEVLAFLPQKWNGIAQSVLTILGSIFKKSPQ